jgi:hypothetical protein
MYYICADPLSKRKIPITYLLQKTYWTRKAREPALHLAESKLACGKLMGEPRLRRTPKSVILKTDSAASRGLLEALPLWR